MPTNRQPSPPNVREDQIRFKNVMKSSESALKKANADEGEAKAIMDQLEKKLDDFDFWQHTTEGTVFFVNKDELMAYSLPFECDERVCAGDSFDVGLAYAACSYDQSFMLLALAVHQPKLFKGTISGLEPVELDLPESPEKALNIDEMFVNSNTVRSVSAGGNAMGSGRFASHGQGDSREAGNEERLMFFRIIDQMLLNDKNFDPACPLVLAGIDAEVAEYKGISKHPHILNGFVSGNHTATQPQDLYRSAWEVVDKELNGNARDAMIDRLNEVMGAGKSSMDPADIRSAADAGRIDTLIVAAITATRDTVSDKAAAITKLISPDWYGRMNVDELIRKVVAQGGKIIGLNAEQLPKGTELAAIYRY